MRHTASFSASDGAAGRRARNGWWQRLAALGVVLSLSVAALAASGAPAARAAGGDAIVHWDSSMIYAGKNNGYPYGPVGEHAVIHGENFVGNIGQTVKLKLIPGDINNPPGGGSAAGMCSGATTKISIGTVEVDSAGKFDFNFDWPSAANHGQYSVCVYDSTDAPAANFDDGPFTVLSAGRPSISLNKTTVAAGSTVTVSGKNWVPPQTIHVLVGPCMFCDAQPIANKDVTSGGLNSGTFSVTLTIPQSVAPGQYAVGAFSDNGVLDVGFNGVKKITVTAPATPTVGPTATVEATSTAVAGAGGSNNGDTGSGQDNNTVLLVALIAGLIGLLFIVLVVAIVLLLRRRPEQQPGQPGPSLPGGYPSGGSPAQGYPQQGYPQQGYAPQGYPPDVYQPQSYPPGSLADSNAPTIDVAVPYVAPPPQTPQPGWNTPPSPPPSQPQAYPARDDAPTRPATFPSDADTFPPTGGSD